ncbi:hypothetical protein ABLN64_02625, partial [Mycobacterium tuberculosis]
GSIAYFQLPRWVFNQNDFHTRVSFRIYRETLSRFSCAASHQLNQKLTVKVIRPEVSWRK